MKKTLIGMVVAACLIALLLRQVDPRQLGMALLGVRSDLLTIGLAIQLIVMWVKSVRWAIAIRAATGRRVHRAFSASMIGFAGNVLLPARLGELARVSVIDKHNQIGRPLALTTVGITQLFDLLILVGYFLIISIWSTSLFTVYRLPIGLLGILTLLTIGGLVVLQKRFHSFRAFLLPIREKFPNVFSWRVRKYGILFIKGLDVLGHPIVVARVLLLTSVAWGLEAIAVYVMLQAFHIKATLFIGALLMIVLNLSFVFPITPGNIGIAQAIAVFFLGAFGVTAESALAYSIGAQATTYLLIVSVGMMCFYREKMNLNLLGQAAREGAYHKSAPATDIY